jgi:hypothetical protein
MAQFVSGSPLSTFKDFLFALIGEDRNNMPLSVLSALARLDLDPWQEAGQLAQLPGETATQRLASLIAELPEGASAHGDVAPIAARLVALLPRHAGSNAGSRGTSSSAVVPSKFPDLTYALLMVFMLVAQVIFASRQPSAKADDVLPPASSTVSPEVPLPNFGR